MNRKTKGALAIGAGAIILLGGAGSYALWSDSEDIAGGAITAGDFGLDCGTTGVWTDISPTMNGTANLTIPSGSLMVPGDVWQFAGTCDVTATGKNIKATLGVDTDGTALPSDNFTVAGTVGGVDVTTAAPAVVSHGDSLAVTVTLTFDYDTPGLEDINTDVSVGALEVTLNQVRP